jgi:predicted aspartyl protease
MIRYAYNRQVTPPAPFVHVSVRCPETGQAVTDLPSLIDTAADRSVIPGRLVEELGLIPLDELPVCGFGGNSRLVLSYLVELTIRDLPPHLVEVLAHPEEPHVLLGRDIMNQHRIILDGPGLALEID